MGNFIPGRLAPEDHEAEFHPALSDMPPLPAIDWGASGLSAPSPLVTPTGGLPDASTVILTWTSSEWAAMNHVFFASQSPTPYSEMNSAPDGWEKYDWGTKSGCPDFWGYYKLVEIGSRPVLLFKSNTHLDEENGEECLEAMVSGIIRSVGCDLMLSIGTSGGTKLSDHVGTVRAVSAGSLLRREKATNVLAGLQQRLECHSHSGGRRRIRKSPRSRSDDEREPHRAITAVQRALLVQLLAAPGRSSRSL